MPFSFDIIPQERGPVSLLSKKAVAIRNTQAQIKIQTKLNHMAEHVYGC